MVNFLTSLSNLKTKVDDSDVDKLKTATIDLKKVVEIVCKEVKKKTKYSKLNLKAKNLEIKSPDVSSLIQINQYNTDKQGLEEKTEGF